MSEQEETAPKTDREGGSAGAGTRDLHAHIGSKLRLMFDEVVQEPIPDKFKQLLEDLERSKPEGS